MDYNATLALGCAALVGFKDIDISRGGVRKYCASLTTGTRIRAQHDVHARLIKYEIEARCATASNALAHDHGGLAKIDCSYATNEILATDFVGYSRKYSNFGPSWERSDLSGVVERLAMGLAASTVYDDFRLSTMRGGNRVALTSLGTLTNPVTASPASVFVPVVTSTVASPYTFEAIAAAANGCGASVCSDYVELDVRDLTPIIKDVGGAPARVAIVEALRILAANMVESAAGDLFSYAYVRGLHKVLTVVGHTDEGGYMRSVFRSSAFAVPYGGIHYNYSKFLGIPSVGNGDRSGATLMVDSALLTSSALVAHCDPTVRHGGNVFPSVFVGGHNVAVPGTIQVADATSGRNVAAMIAASSDEFSRLYIEGLKKLFSAAGDSGKAAAHMRGAMHAISLRDERHCQYPVVMPFFFIEPTSLLPPNFLGSAAELAGFGSLAAPQVDESYPCFEEGTVDGELASVMATGLIVKWRNARSQHLVNHLLNSPKNGLGATEIRQVDPDSVICPGGDATVPLGDRILGGVSVADLLWERGQSPLPAPGEFIVSDAAMGIEFSLYSGVTGSSTLTPTHLPSRNELLSGRVSYSVTMPFADEGAKANERSVKESRARTRAALSLSAAREAHLTGIAQSREQFPIQLKMPRLPRASPPLATADVILSEDRSKPSVVEVASPAPADESVDAGAKETPHLHLGAQSAPKVRAAAPTQSGGGGSAPRSSSLARPASQDQAAQGEELEAAPLPRAADQ